MRAMQERHDLMRERNTFKHHANSDRSRDYAVQFERGLLQIL